tara:strand:- start:1549 stop:2019 length:471 start_codon:yes stop_codon:yes gene_type:complete
MGASFWACTAVFLKTCRNGLNLIFFIGVFIMANKHCDFCEITGSRLITENDLTFAMHDLYPVTDLHSLVIPKRHVSDYFDLSQAEIQSVHALLTDVRRKIQALDESITGFNIGVNSGEDAGQTIFHCHIHLIPRRKGDTKNPRGGVRGVIPEKQSY